MFDDNRGAATSLSLLLDIGMPRLDGYGAARVTQSGQLLDAS